MWFEISFRLHSLCDVCNLVFVCGIKRADFALQATNETWIKISFTVCMVYVFDFLKEPSTNLMKSPLKAQIVLIEIHFQKENSKRN